MTEIPDNMNLDFKSIKIQESIPKAQTRYAHSLPEANTIDF